LGGSSLPRANAPDSLEQGFVNLSRGKLEDAIGNFTSALTQIDSERNRDRWLLANAQLGEIYLRLNRIGMAERHLTVAANGGFIDSLVTLAVIAERDNDFNLAKARRALAAARGHGESLSWLEDHT
jgi:hypothetical protein